MSGVHKRTFSLTETQAKYIDEKVASGAFVSGSEVVREGLRAMQMRDAAIDKWLRDEVMPTLEAYEANPESALSRDALRAEFDGWLAKAEADKKR